MRVQDSDGDGPSPKLLIVSVGNSFSSSYQSTIHWSGIEANGAVVWNGESWWSPSAAFPSHLGLTSDAVY
jgi:hypothetical protein